jgi:hypothetical protein
VIGNYAARFYLFAMGPVRVLQNTLETQIFDRVQRLESRVMAAYRKLSLTDDSLSAAVIPQDYDYSMGYSKYGIDTGNAYANAGINTGSSDASAGINTGSADASKGVNTGASDASAGINTGSADASKGINTGAADASKGINTGGSDASAGINTGSADASKGINTGSADASKGINVGGSEASAGINTGSADASKGINIGGSDASAGINTGSADASRGISTGAADASKGINTGAADASAGINTGAADASKGINTGAADASKGINTGGSDASAGINTGSADASKGINTGAADASKGINVGGSDASAGINTGAADANKGINTGNAYANNGISTGNSYQNNGIDAGQAYENAGISSGDQYWNGAIVDYGGSQEKLLNNGQKEGDEQAAKEKTRDNSYIGGGTGYAKKWGHSWSPYASGNWYSAVDGVELMDGAAIKLMLTQFTVFQGQEISDSWTALFPQILAQFRDGYVVNTTVASIQVNKMFYPEWWLNAVGYFDIPPNNQTGAILFAFNPFSTGYVTTGFWLLSMFFTAAVAGMFSAIIALKYAKSTSAFFTPGDFKYEGISMGSAAPAPASNTAFSLFSKKSDVAAHENEYLFGSSSYQHKFPQQRKYTAMDDEDNL